MSSRNWSIFNEDAVEWAKNYTGEKFHALLTDAPYHLTSIVKRFSKSKIGDGTKTSEKVANRSDGYSRLMWKSQKNVYAIGHRKRNKTLPCSSC